jgi:uncharacterized protein DUF4328
VRRLATVSIGLVAVPAAIESTLLFARSAEIERANGLLASYRLAVTGNALLDTLEVVIGVASLGALAGWLAWQYRAVSLLQAGGLIMKRTPAWAILWWFVPGAHLWMPAVTNAEVWRGSQAPAGKVGRPWLVWIWWVLLIVGWLTHDSGQFLRHLPWGVQGGQSIFTPDDVVANVRVGGLIAGAGATALIAAAPFARLVLVRITRRLADAGPAILPARPDV